MSKPTIDQSKVTEIQRLAIEVSKQTGKNVGIANKRTEEPLPVYEVSQVENVITSQNNCFVILGKDRPSHLKSGFGGRGATQAGRIDLIAGLNSSFRHPDGRFSPPNEGTIVNPNFALDAARIYMSQKADIDRYMGLAQVPKQSKPGASAIGLKADAIRIHSRNDIKIVTGRARIAGTGKTGERFSLGGINEKVGTISFIAGNYTDGEFAGGVSAFNPLKKIMRSKSKLQPIVKGDNLVECLEEIIGVLGELSSLIGTNTSLINQMNGALAAHIHVLPLPAPIPTLPSPVYAPVAPVIVSQATSAIASRTTLNGKLEMLKINHLNKFAGKNYINSKYVFTT